jgi:hypothetical protein
VGYVGNAFANNQAMNISRLWKDTYGIPMTITYLRYFKVGHGGGMGVCFVVAVIYYFVSW